MWKVPVHGVYAALSFLPLVVNMFILPTSHTTTASLANTASLINTSKHLGGQGACEYSITPECERLTWVLCMPWCDDSCRPYLAARHFSAVAYLNTQVCSNNLKDGGDSQWEIVPCADLFRTVQSTTSAQGARQQPSCSAHMSSKAESSRTAGTKTQLP